MPMTPRAITPADRSFAENLYTVRTARGLRKVHLTTRVTEAGLSFGPSALGRIERCERTVTIGEALVFCKVLDVDLADMTSGPIKVQLSS
jgi:hypothetical protein